MTETPQQGVIQSAGGLVWRRSSRGAELALIYHSRRKQWTLPKGHLRPDESWQVAAVREVLEETGCQVRLGSFAGTVSYTVKGVPKVVMFWNMLLVGDCQFQPSHEASELSWMTVPEALEKLHHDGERRVLREVAEKKWPRRFRPGEEVQAGE